MNNKIIAKLTDARQARAFGLLSVEEQDIIRKAGIENCLYFAGKHWTAVSEHGVRYDRTYILKPNYEPEPEYLDRPVALASTGLLEAANVSIMCLVSWPDFLGFYVDAKTPGERFVGLENIATAIREGKKVIARFEKE